MNNIFIAAGLGIHVDNRNQGWAKSIMLKDGTYDQRLKMVKYNEPHNERFRNLFEYCKNRTR